MYTVHICSNDHFLQQQLLLRLVHVAYSTFAYIQVHLDEDGWEIDEDKHRSIFQFAKIEPRLLPILLYPYH